MGEVHRARDSANGEFVALKRLSSETLDHSSLLSFKREYHTLASLEHPNIIKAYEFGIEDDIPYYTMRLLEDGDMDSLQSMSLADACSSLRDVASALAYLHSRRLIHRDVTMRNVRVEKNGRATLFDFGIMGMVGAPSEAAGTPPFVSPETLQQLPLDHRVDLFSLGALAYRALTGFHAYPARTFRELPTLWELGPRPLREFRDDIPLALDHLIIGLLAPKRLARPSSASEVIDALTAIGELPPLPESEVTRGYLASAALVGRQREMKTIEQRLTQVGPGSGKVILVQATSGTGKSRLLTEAGLVAQLSGFVSIYIDCGKAQGSYGVVSSIVCAAQRIMPDLAIEAALPDLEILERIVPALADKRDISSTKTRDETGGDRVRTQQALVRWLARLLKNQRIFLAIDDLQRADEASASFLASITLIASELSVMLIFGQRIGEYAVAETPIATIEKHAEILALRGLDEQGVSELVVATFGTQIVDAEFSKWMHRVCDGNPMRLAALSNQLVQQGVLRFQHGEWSLATSLDEAVVPSSLGEAMDALVIRLDDDARQLGQILAVLGGDWSLQDLVNIAERGADETFSDVDALIVHDILIQKVASDSLSKAAEQGEKTEKSESRFQLRHDGLREALLRSTSEELLITFNLRAARFLEKQKPPVAARIAWHLLRGGEQRRAAEMLAEVGSDLFDMYSMRDAIGPMKAALAVFENLGVDATVCMELRRRIVVAAIFCDQSVVMQYIDSSLDLAWRYAGMHVANIAGKVVGRTLGFLVGIGWASVSRLLRRKNKRGPTPLAAVGDLFSYFTGRVIFAVHTFEVDTIDAIIERMRVIGVFNGKVSMGTYRLCVGFSKTFSGGIGTINEHVEYCFRTLQEDTTTPLAPADRLIAKALVKNFICFGMMLRCDPAIDEAQHAVKQFGIPNFDVTVQNEIATVRRAQGLEPECLRMLSEIETRAVQLGSTWTADTMVHWQSSLGFALTGDRMGLRRNIREMKKLDQQGVHCVQHIALAEAEYALLQYDLKGARKALEAAKACTFELLHQPMLAMEAELLLAEGKLEQAFAVASEGMAASVDPDSGLPIYQSRYVAVLAWSKTCDEGLALIRQSLSDLTSFKNPAASGRLCECASLLSWRAGKEEEFEHFWAEAESLYTPTDNPVLLRRLEELRSLRRTNAFGDTSDAKLNAARRQPEVLLVSTLIVTDGDDNCERDEDPSTCETIKVGPKAT